MKKIDITIIGAGGIGLRHIQSCCNLSPEKYNLHVVDPDEQQLEKINNIISDIKIKPSINWYASIYDLPDKIDMAIIATRSDTRSKAIIKIVNKNPSYLLLEKVLFQTLEEYDEIGRLLKLCNIQAWVNTPSRIWPGYVYVKDYIKNRSILKITTVGANWDLGCNSIHFLDLFAYLSNTYNLKIDTLHCNNVEEAKRKGMLHIEGEIHGQLFTEQNSQSISIIISSNPCFDAARKTKITFTDMEIICTETADTIEVLLPDGSTKEFSIPYQSQLTASTVNEIYDLGKSSLTNYYNSVLLHKPMLIAFMNDLYVNGYIKDKNVCPIT